MTELENIEWCPQIQAEIDRLIAAGESPMNAASVAIDSELIARRIALPSNPEVS